MVLEAPAPLAANDVLAHRLLSPLSETKLRAALAAAGRSLGGMPVDLTKERYLLYAPSREPAGGYGLLVFIPPWSAQQAPIGWPEVFERAGVIFVSAANSGNDANAFGRREPLAVAAAQAVMVRYPVDPGKVYVGGFSGGARVALRVALGYPDLFRGVLLNAGSDSIGDAAAPLPPPDLFRRFQTSTRLIYLTGANDQANLDADGASRVSMSGWCVGDLEVQTVPGIGHQAAPATALARALDALAAPPRQPPKGEAACVARVGARVAQRLDQAAALIGQGHAREARDALIRIDATFGGLAAPRSLDLYAQADAAP